MFKRFIGESFGWVPKMFLNLKISMSKKFKLIGQILLYELIYEFEVKIMKFDWLIDKKIKQSILWKLYFREKSILILPLK